MAPGGLDERASPETQHGPLRYHHLPARQSQHFRCLHAPRKWRVPGALTPPLPHPQSEGRELTAQQVHYYDTYNNGGEAGLRDHIFAETISVDYTAFGFGPPRDYKRDEWVAEIGRLLGLYKATQHIVR